ncbi:HNH endonuclease [Nonomuraea sp. NBC_00507]|uniref:HNH endonuclease n=1 Tax=Nonomuraea sp. NBC_00507 TaxID=2976002 RepID=UPI003FA5DC74
MGTAAPSNNFGCDRLANRICNQTGCHEIAPHGGRCSRHRPKPWSRVSARNRTRPSNWRRRRHLVLSRDGHRCYVCHQLGAGEVDHIVPVARGGTHDMSNLAAICKSCHEIKSAADRRPLTN